jgi:RNA polymerase sigma-70 factor (ECF subfamily)
LDDRSHDALLVLRSQCGDREALEELLGGVQSKLHAHIMRVSGPKDADDIAQDVLFQICLHLPLLREPQFFRAWAYRIATRAAFKSRGRFRLWLNRHDAEAEVEDLFIGEDVCSTILANELLVLMDNISPASRAVLSLHYVEDFTIGEIAAILQLDVGTVKSRLAYGLKSLRTAATQSTTR